MASVIKIKRSGNTSAPSELGSGELAYSWNSNKLFIGFGTETEGVADNIGVIGGAAYVDMLDHTPGTLTASSAIVVDSDSKIDNLLVDNLQLNGNSISSTNTDGNIIIIPDGTGKTVITNLYIDADTTSIEDYILGLTGGSLINGNNINIVTANGTSTISLVSDVTGLTSLAVDNISVDGNTISTTDNNGNLVLAPNGTGSVSVNSAKITNVANPTQAQDAATKAYVDAVRTGLDIKDSVRVATTGDIALSGTQSIDGIAVIVGDRVLVKDQSIGLQNGIYVVAAGAWTRSTDFNSSTNVTGGAFTFVEEGTANADSGWVVITDGTINVGVTTINFAQFSGAGQVVAGDGLTKTGNTINAVGTQDKISVTADAITIASTYAGQTSITTLGTVGTGTWQADTVAVSYGGTGLTTATTNGIVYGNGTNALGVTAAGSWDATNSTGQILSVNSSGTPTWTWALDGGTF